jgi:predicted histone-like DNA-binding protein
MDYIMQEMPDIHKTGEKKYYPKVKHYSCIPHETITQLFMDMTRMSRNAIEGVMKELPVVMNTFLSQGHSVKIEGFGTFDVILGQLTEKEMQDIAKKRKVHANRDGVYIKKIHFRPDTSWMLALRGTTDLLNGKNEKDQFRDTLTEADRLEIALAYIEKNGSINAQEYRLHTALGLVKAERELTKFSKDPESGIACISDGTSKLYVKR